MQAKLTLTIDQDIVVKAKSYAQKKHRSISGLVEDYLKTVSEAETILTNNYVSEAPLTNSITGMFKDEYNGQAYNEILQAAILEKYS
jgi:hypothetical protein